MSKQEKLFLLDAYALIFRAYYAFIKNPVKNSKGLVTSPMLGFTNMLDELIRKEEPTHIAVAFDPPGPTFRKEIYPEYKANRAPTPEDIIKAIPYIKRIIQGFRIPIIEVENFEADDVIGTLATQIAAEHSIPIYMMTPDKDYFQLVSKSVFLYKPRRSGYEADVLGLEEVCEKFSISDPKQFIDILAIWGDSVDNIPGIPGIGEKSSRKLISKYGSINGIYEHIDELKGKQKENVIASKELVEISKKLVTIDVNVPVDITLDDLKFRGIDKKSLREVFDELEFRTLANRILGVKEKTNQPVQQSLFDQPHLVKKDEQKEEQVEPLSYATIDTTEHSYHLVDTVEEYKKLRDLLMRQKSICFDTETTSIDVHQADLVGLSFCVKPFEAWYVPVPVEREKVLEVLDLFKPVFENQDIEKTGQNIKYDISILSWYGIEVKGKLFDTMIAHYLLHPEQKHNMDYLSEVYLGYKPVSIETLIGKKGKPQLSMRQVPVKKVKEYASEDADVTLRLREKLEPELSEKGLRELFDTIEMPLIYVLSDMECAGVKLDTAVLEGYMVELRESIDRISKEIINLAGTNFNIASPKQLGEILFEKLKITDKPKLTKTKQYATGESELLNLRDKHPIIDKILDFRSLTKLLNTYVETLPQLINKRTGKIHTSFNQAITATGRLSSNNPNLQNIPIRTDEGRRIREAFIPSDENHVLLSADYSQIELRLMAHMSKDETMIQDFAQGEDIHTATAAKVFGVKTEEVTREMRSQAKSANFGIIYGISAFGLSNNLKISRSQAKELIDNYFKTYPKIKEYMDSSIEFARKHTYVETMKGRKRYLNDIHSRNGVVRGVAERNAINTPIQGSAADLIKIAMINIHRKFKEQNIKSRVILQVHDELVIDALKDELETVNKIIVHEMEHAETLSVPLVADFGSGNNWLEAH